MGGNNPLIVKNIENIKTLIYTIIQSAFITSGQRCTCARRLFIPMGEKGDELINALINATQNLVIGKSNDDPPPFIGPIVSNIAAKALRRAYQSLVDSGGKSLLELQHLDEKTGFVTPGIVDVTHIEVTDEEYFGPLLQIIRYQNFEKAIEQANNTRFGLAAGLLGGNQQDYEIISPKYSCWYC